MSDIPGKSCGGCSLCCKILEIAEWEKPAGEWCGAWCAGKGSGIYGERPEICRAYECLWKGDRSLSPQFRPDRTGTILMEDPDSDEYRAVCDPARPMAWRELLIFNHLLKLAKSGRRAVAKAGLKSWRIHAKGHWRPCL